MIGHGQPCASVVIPSKDRPQDLCTLLQSLRDQRSVAEVIVLLDGDNSETHDLVRNRFPEVQLQMSDRSHGPLFQRNRGARIAACEFVVTLDDDIILQSPDTIRQTLALFDSENIGCVTIPFINTDEEHRIVRSGAPGPDTTRFTSAFGAGAAAFRKSAYLAVGGYREFLFMHVEESDLAIRLMDKGYLVRLGTADPVLHTHSPRRDNERLHFLGARNHILFALFCVPLPHIAAHLPMTILNCVWHGIRINRFGTVVRGILAGIRDAITHFDQRRPVSPRVYGLSRRLRD